MFRWQIRPAFSQRTFPACPELREQVGISRLRCSDPQEAAVPADLTSERDRMVDRQIAGRGIADRHVLDAMRRVPRERFVAPGFEEFAYEDTPLPIDEGQTISQPYIVALMIKAAEVKPGDRVLDVGTGSGYAAAIVSLIADHVYTIERHETLAQIAERRFAELGYRNISVTHGDGTRGWPDAAPFDAILIAAGGPDIPQPLRNQLAIGGRLIIPVGTELHDQRLIKLVRRSATEFEEEDLGAVAFVPLVGEHGWPGTEPDRADRQPGRRRPRQRGGGAGMPEGSWQMPST